MTSPAIDLESVVCLSDPTLTYEMGAPYPPPNRVYSAVVRLLEELGLDCAGRGTPSWNPLRDLVPVGGKVVIKPNLVSSRNREARITGEKLFASSTHGSLLRPLIDFAVRAVGERGSVRVIDAPIEGCELDKVTGPLGIDAVIADQRRRGNDVDFIDLRSFRMQPRMLVDDARLAGRSWNGGLLTRVPLPGDPRGYRVVDLGERSWFARPDAPPAERLRFHRSHYRTPVAHHSEGRHEYSMPNTLLESDLLIQLAKMKTHKKTGVTLNLKGAIGLTNQKYWLPHFTEGDPSVGGDEFFRPRSGTEALVQALSRLPLPAGHSLILRAPRVGASTEILDGSWEGNRTLHRTILDLTELSLYADRQGRLGQTPARRYLGIVDGIVAGEGEGPLGASPVAAGLLLGGFDPGRVDAVAAREMGFDPKLIQHLADALERGYVAPPVARDRSNEIPVSRIGGGATRRFRPPRAWPSLL